MEPQRAATESDLTSLESSQPDRQPTDDVDTDGDSESEAEEDARNISYTRIFSERSKKRISRATLNASHHSYGEYSWSNPWMVTCKAAFPAKLYYDVIQEQPTQDKKKRDRTKADTKDSVDIQVAIFLEDRKVVVATVELKDPDEFEIASERENANEQVVDRLNSMYDQKDPLLPDDIPVVSAFGPRYKVVCRNSNGFSPTMYGRDPNFLDPDRAPESEWNYDMTDLNHFAVFALELRRHFDRVLPLSERKEAFDKIAAGREAQLRAANQSTLPEYTVPNYGLPPPGQVFLPIQYRDSGSVSSLSYSSADSEDNFVAQADGPIYASDRKLRPRKK